MTEFTFVTYNIDSREYNFEERINTFFKLIKNTLPDVIAIQEGSRLTYEKLLREMGLLGYKRHLLDIMHHRSTGEMIFSKLPMEINYISFQRGNENRGLSVAKIDLWGKEVWICTAQLDSNVALRRCQIASFPSLLKYIDSNKNIIFGGDTRLFEYQTDQQLPPGWHDAWYEAGNNSSKYTVNSDCNLLVAPPNKDRPDQVWYRPSVDGAIECIDCKLYGENSEIIISSHYGVWTKFKL
uniref:Endonuclease/exonuclease/phosphatase family protein n=1 Tax=Marseillevirus LCMAC102 TaxID=2506603 RepID=A0A481YTS2_9VIRU|nr:MAG: endonuclease/exonuclease/phosphatase family protein [Marseillevirus LCMAC102]